MLKAVLFDMDDTLLDWSGFNSDWTTLESRLLGGVLDFIRAEGHPINDVEAYATEFHNRTMTAWADSRTSMRAPNVGSVLIEAAVALGVPPGVLDYSRCLDAYAWDAVPGTTVFPDVPALIETLQAHNVRVGIVTNAYQPMRLRDTELRTHDLLHLFPECRISAADVGYLKPHPTIFQTALNCLNIKPTEAVFIGDNPEADIAGAQSVGMRAVLRGNAHQQPISNYLIKADAAIKSFAELPPLLDQWFPAWRQPAAT
ncbi:MAG: HAD family hydrolase [Chloroflexi bacterium]|nr:HAD family hydrolase [Chloroflexota bacterium]